ncbi:MAG: alpha-galactosidase [Anaerolineales bacterium]
MPQILENSAIQLEINAQIARWSARSRTPNGPILNNLQLNLGYRRGHKYKDLLDRWPNYSIGEAEVPLASHGQGKARQILIDSHADQIKCTISFALPADYPLLLWKISVENQGHKAIHIEQIELLSAGYIHRGRYGPDGEILFPKSIDQRAVDAKVSSHPFNLAFFSNGWQSWSRTGSYRSSDQYLQTRLGFLRAPLVKNPQTPNPRRSGMFVSDMFAVLGNHTTRKGILCGFLSQKKHFGSLECWLGGNSPTLKMRASGDGARLDPGKQMETDWACLQFLHLDHPDPLAPYLEAVMREHNLTAELQSEGKPPTGWCSWYQFSSEDYIGRLSAGDIQANIQSIREVSQQIPLEIIQIDDGFESQVGDWFTFNQGFEAGVKPLAQGIRDAEFVPGIWLAPFIMHPKSSLANEHPEWILRNRLGRPVNAGFLWNSFARALDLTHPDAQQYVKEVIRSATESWGFSYLKLDFLYAAALPGCFFDDTQTRAEVLRSGLEIIRSQAGDHTFVLGCGCPLGPAIGLVDGMRISADTARRWNPYFKGIELLLKKEASFPSAFNAVHNALTRSDLHQRWWINDPDCLLLRPETELTKTEVETIASVIALTGGSLMISDHVPALPQERLDMLRTLLPIIGKRPYILDWFDSSTPERVQLDLEGATGSWHLIGLFNWEESAQDKILNLSDFYLETRGEIAARDFWSGKTYFWDYDHQAEHSHVFPQVPAHGVVLLALRTCRSHRPQYLGSNLHISQGLEVTEWRVLEKGLELTIERPGKTIGRIDIYLPGKIHQAAADTGSLTWKAGSNGSYSFDLECEDKTRLDIEYR